VYGIVKQHGGYIVVYSRPDQGTAFQIYLPLSKIEGKTREPFSSRPERKGTETILIADDDETVRQMLAEILSLSGYTVLEAMDGLEAIEKFHRCREISLIILDQMMPRKNGLEAFREIKKANPAAKILLMSGYTSDRFIGPNPPEGAPEFISKPISPSAFLLQVGNMLDR
jgi:CheY-like chemotaxis protein